MSEYINIVFICTCFARRNRIVRFNQYLCIYSVLGYVYTYKHINNKTKISQMFHTEFDYNNLCTRVKMLKKKHENEEAKNLRIYTEKE